MKWNEKEDQTQKRRTSNESIIQINDKPNAKSVTSFPHLFQIADFCFICFILFCSCHIRPIRIEKKWTSNYWNKEIELRISFVGETRFDIDDSLEEEEGEEGGEEHEKLIIRWNEAN